MNIFCIPNDGDRNKVFIELFSSFEGQGYGRKVNNYFIINSELSSNGNSLAETGFRMIQNKANSRGFGLCMYVLGD